MRKAFRGSVAAWFLAGLALCLSAAAEDPGIIDIPYTKFVLDNGLTVLVHEDHKAPIVALNVWYHVGSKNEKPGKTGFAHLFEHLMFNGSENYNDDYFNPLNRAGATGLNGTTNQDRTNYFQNVPKTALDLALWMESDRMGHLLGAVDQDKLDEQRGVVQNEVRQSENQPYGRAFKTLVENTYPEGHPYSWSTGGSLEDLDAASLDDVHEWFKAYYGAANATIAIAGAIGAESVRAKVEKYFGDIAPGPPVERPTSWIAKRSGTRRHMLQDRVPQSRVYMAWNISERNHADTQYLQLASQVLTSGKTSRFYKRLVYDDQIATDVSSFVLARELGGLFLVTATAQPGGDAAVVEEALREELQHFLSEGPTEEELRRAKTRQRAAFIRGVERIGGFGGKSDILIQNEIFAGDPGFHKVIQKRHQTATAQDVHSAAQRWLDDGDFVLEIRPFPELKVAEQGVDRSTGVPQVDEFPEVKFSSYERARLSNGLEVILARRDTVPVVNLNLILDAGYAADQFGIPGTASLVMNMIDEGTKTRSALEISEGLSGLGADLGASSDIDTSTVFLSALKENLAPSLEIFADVVLNPVFPESDLDRLKKQQQAAIQREKSSPLLMALRVFPQLVFGQGHAYSLPFTGSGTEDSVKRLTREDLVRFHKTWFKPNHAKLVVAGDATMDEMKGHLEKLFQNWRPSDIPRKNLAEVDHQDTSTVYIVDRPGSVQSFIMGGHVAPPKAGADEFAFESMNRILGVGFSSRINMNLREDKNWSYGAGSMLVDTQAQRTFLVFAPVQTDKTRESLAEIQKELEEIRGQRPPDPEEVARVKDEQTLSLSGRWETANAVMGSLVEMVQYGLPENYWDTYAGKIRSLSEDDVARAAKTIVRPDRMVWVVVGDREKIEAGVRELGLGEIRLIDSDANLVGP